MESRAQAAAELKRSGKMNCAQAVACTYCDLAGTDEETMKKACRAFAVGMGGMEATCGAIAGAAVVLGFMYDNQGKSMKASKYVISKFKEQNGATQCRDIKGVDDGVLKRECPDCVADAARFLEEIIEANEADK